VSGFLPWLENTWPEGWAGLGGLALPDLSGRVMVSFPGPQQMTFPSVNIAGGAGVISCLLHLSAHDEEMLGEVGGQVGGRDGGRWA